MPADGEQLGAELIRAALLELRQVADHLEPGLSGYVVDVIAADDLQVAEEPWLQGLSEHQEAGLVAAPGADERIVERGPARFGHHRVSMLPHSSPRMLTYHVYAAFARGQHGRRTRLSEPGPPACPRAAEGGAVR